MADDDGERGNERSGANQDWLEIAASAVSALAIAAVMGYLVWQGFQGEKPAAFEATIGSVRAAGDSYLLPVTVRNTGDEAAQDVQVSVKLTVPGKPEAEARATIDWVPGKSERRAVAVLKENPAQGTVKAGVEGYQEP